MWRDLLYLPGAIWRSHYGKSLTVLALAMACLWSGHLFVFLVLIHVAYIVYGFEL